jgi:signal peptidase II|tara:strand:+ start:1218 stop:1676 length:459 start_codon:yes stop_codon:yes gene_type:complete
MLSFTVIIIDQITKYFAVEKLALHEVKSIYEGFNLILIYNEGAAFSFLSDAGGWQRWFLIGVSCVVCVFIVVWMYQSISKSKCLLAGLSLILGGALGNLWDRLSLGYVVDFIEVYYKDLYWPAFNIADSAITIGAILLILDIFLKEPSKTPS